jgi:hypothetical protein
MVTCVKLLQRGGSRAWIVRAATVTDSRGARPALCVEQGRGHSSRVAGAFVVKNTFGDPGEQVNFSHHVPWVPEHVYFECSHNPRPTASSSGPLRLLVL